MVVYEYYDDKAMCPILVDVPVLFEDTGMDAAGTCSSANGGCSLKYSFREGVNRTDQGIQFGPFTGGKPNIAPVSTCSFRHRLRIYVAHSVLQLHHSPTVKHCTLAACVSHVQGTQISLQFFLAKQ